MGIGAPGGRHAMPGATAADALTKAGTNTGEWSRNTGH